MFITASAGYHPIRVIPPIIPHLTCNEMFTSILAKAEVLSNCRLVSLRSTNSRRHWELWPCREIWTSSLSRHHWRGLRRKLSSAWRQQLVLNKSNNIPKDRRWREVFIPTDPFFMDLGRISIYVVNPAIHRNELQTDRHLQRGSPQKHSGALFHIVLGLRFQVNSCWWRWSPFPWSNIQWRVAGLMKVVEIPSTC